MAQPAQPFSAHRGAASSAFVDAYNPFAAGARSTAEREALRVPDDAPPGSYTYSLVQSGPDVAPEEAELIRHRLRRGDGLLGRQRASRCPPQPHLQLLHRRTHKRWSPHRFSPTRGGPRGGPHAARDRAWRRSRSRRSAGGTRLPRDRGAPRRARRGARRSDALCRGRRSSSDRASGARQRSGRDRSIRLFRCERKCRQAVTALDRRARRSCAGGVVRGFAVRFGIDGRRSGVFRAATRARRRSRAGTAIDCERFSSTSARARERELEASKD